MFSLQQFFNASAPSSNLGKTFTGMMLGYDVDNFLVTYSLDIKYSHEALTVIFLFLDVII